MRTCMVIADADAVVGFRLAGVEAVAAAGPVEAERILRERVAAGGTAIVLVNQAFLDGFSPAMRHSLDRIGLPLVIPIPIAPAAGARSAPRTTSSASSGGRSAFR